jgi:hypothetical protein
MKKAKKGVVYVATRREHYLAEAFLSAQSIKDFEPELPITLFTDLTESPLARADCFDQTISIDTVRTYKSLWSEGQLDRVSCLINTPYEYTLHLDTDTRVLTPEFIQLFDRLKTIDIGMAICQKDVSKCSQLSGLAMFNVGFILFRKNEKTDQLLEAWQELTRSHFDMANMEELPDVEYLRHIEDPETRRELLFMDQTSFVQLLSPEVNRFDLELEIVDECWNFRGTGSARTFEGPVKISHHPSLRNQLGEDVLKRIEQYWNSGNGDFSRDLLITLRDKLISSENQAGRKMVQGLIDQLTTRP